MRFEAATVSPCRVPVGTVPNLGGLVHALVHATLRANEQSPPAI